MVATSSSSNSRASTAGRSKIQCIRTTFYGKSVTVGLLTLTLGLVLVSLELSPVQLRYYRQSAQQNDYEVEAVSRNSSSHLVVQNKSATTEEEDVNDKSRRSNVSRVPHILTNKRPTNNQQQQQQQQRPPIRQISLIGERNSGTTWITRHLRTCFNHTLPVISDLARHKHWFQHDVLPSMRVPQTLVIAQFRSPCQWVQAMRAKCYRAPMHYKLEGGWETFVKTPWTMPKRLKYDYDLVQKYKSQHGGMTDTTQIACQENFTYNQVNSCLRVPYLEGKAIQERAKRRAKRRAEWGEEDDGGMSGQEPLYELRNDGSGRAYSTVLELRADKIKNFLGVYEWDWVEAVLPIQYEEMVRDGTREMLRRVEELTGVEARCEPFAPQGNRTTRELPGDFVEWMTEFLDWDAEALIGYDSC